MAIKLLIRSISLFTLFLMFFGCASTGPSKDMKVGHDPLLDQNGGVVAVVDICIKRDEVGEEGTDDYFIIEESKVAAQALYDATRDYLVDNGVQVRKAIIPFVCGALHDEANSKKKVAERANGEIKDLSQPFGVNSEIKDDEEYMNALSIVSTYVAQYESGAQLSEFIVGADEVKAAADVIADRTQSSSVLYLNVAGTTISSGKAFGQWLGRFTVGVVTAVATAGLGTGYYGYYVPGGEPDVRYVGAAIVDIDSGVITWSNGLRAIGDPIDPEVIADPNTLDLLLFDLVHESATAMSIKNENIQLLNAYAGNKAQLVSMKPPEQPLELCRGGVRVGNVLTTHRRIQESFNNVLKSAGVYDSGYGVRLSGSLNKIDFSSSSSDAWWDMEVTLSTEDDRAITVQSRYEFESSFGGASACQNTKEAFHPAVQKLIKDIVNNSEFHDLVTIKVSKLDQPTM